MRPLLALSLFAVMLGLTGLTGCNLPKRLKGNGSSGGTGQPFVGSPSSDPATAPTTDDSSTLASKQSAKVGKGFLAGEVIDTARRRVPNATIKVTETEPGKEAAAPLSVTTDKGGYFDVSGLDAGRSYRLTARKRDGNRYMTGSVRVRSPDVRVVIPLTGEEPVSASDRTEEKTNGKEETKASPAALGFPVPHKSPPAAEFVPPAKSDEQRIAPPPPQADADPVPSLPVPKENGSGDPTLIGKENKNGFEREPVPANIPGPGGEPKRKPVEPVAPPPPPMGGDNGVGLKPSTAPSAAPREGASDELPATHDQTSLPTKVVVPSCVKVGNQVRNFALYDYDGKVWELSKKRRGQLVLLEFWFSKCIPCKHTIPYLNDLDRDYRSYGLDVVSVAHEKGTPVEKQDAVRPIRQREKITYPILFTGGGNEADCPVLRQLEIHEYPTLILLDRNGKILWRGNGLNPHTKYQLTMFIRKHLGVPTR